LDFPIRQNFMAQSRQLRRNRYPTCKDGFFTMVLDNAARIGQSTSDQRMTRGEKMPTYLEARIRPISEFAKDTLSKNRHRCQLEGVPMKQQWLSRNGQFVLGVCLASLLTVLATETRVSAQDGQGKYITEATVRLTKLVNAANGAGYILQDNSFSIGGGWLKQSTANWVPLYTVQLVAGKKYRFIAAGDVDAKDVDLEVQDANGKTVASDTATNPEAVVEYTPAAAGRYTVRIRLYASDNNDPCVCLAIVMAKKN